MRKIEKKKRKNFEYYFENVCENLKETVCFFHDSVTLSSEIIKIKKKKIKKYKQKKEKLKKVFETRTK